MQDLARGLYGLAMSGEAPEKNRTLASSIAHRIYEQQVDVIPDSSIIAESSPATQLRNDELVRLLFGLCYFNLAGHPAGEYNAELLLALPLEELQAELDYETCRLAVDVFNSLRVEHGKAQEEIVQEFARR